jgi:hypothetical protein
MWKTSQSVRNERETRPLVACGWLLPVEEPPLRLRAGRDRSVLGRLGGRVPLVGSWYSGSWYDSGAVTHIDDVQTVLAQRAWLGS